MTIVRITLAVLCVMSMPLHAQQAKTQKKNPAGAQSKAPAKSQTKAPAKTPAKASAKAPTKTPPKAVAPAVVAAAAAVPALPETPANDSYNLKTSSAVLNAPSSTVIGQMQKGANVEVIAREKGWTRVRIEGWVPDSILAPADTTYRSGMSAADLRSDPDAARGKMVIWNVEFLALQTADPLRHGLADEEPYVLARGPNTENALLYLVVPPSLMGTARALQPLTRITVAARVRDGRSEPVGIPILDLQTIRRIQ
jgi:hypothetical protein